MDTAGFTIGTARYGGARHPFRASLPRRVLRTLPEFEPEVARRLADSGGGETIAAEPAHPAEPRRVPRWLGITARDVKDFLIAYIACLLAVMTYLS